MVGLCLSAGSVTFGQVSTPSITSPRSQKIHRTMYELIDQQGSNLINQQGSNRLTKGWVLFRNDKGYTTQAACDVEINETQRTYNTRATQRRRLRRTRPGLFDMADVPVPTDWVDAVVATGAKVGVVSRWVCGASVWATPQQFEVIAELPFVEKIQPVRQAQRIEPLTDKSASGAASVSTSTSGTFYGQAEPQLLQLNLIALHQLGFTGAGVRIGVLDTGFKRTHVAYNEPGAPINVIAEFDFVNMDGNTSFETGDPASQHEHGTKVLSTMAGFKPNEYVGAAYDADFILCKTEDTTAEYMGEEDNYVAGLEFIEMNGGDVVTSSLGYIDWYTQADLDGLTAITTLAVNIATGNGLHCVNSAGNSGHDTNPATSTLIAPADALEVITVGAVNSLGNIASFSSEGPTADGRVKPEVLAWGLGTSTISSSSDTLYANPSGTSFSAPLLAGVVACLVQAHPNWTVQQMRDALFTTAGDFVANGTTDPLFIRGYGVVDAVAASNSGPAIPAASQWGLIVLSLIVLITGSVVLVSRIGHRHLPSPLTKGGQRGVSFFN